jgi:opacity protein-like surface antigen
MERKIPCTLSLLSLLFAYSSAYAGTEGAKPGYPDGFMLGAGAGVTEFMDSGTYSTTVGHASSSTSNGNFRFGFMGDVFVGYGRRIREPFYFGTELGLNIFGVREVSSSHTAQADVTANIFDDSHITTQEALATTTRVSGNVFVPFFDIKPGLLVTPNSLLFARIGVNYNQLNVRRQSSYQSSSIETNEAIIIAQSSAYSGLYSSEKKQLIGVRTGLGFEYLISDNLGLSANYVYAFYNSVNFQTIGTSNQAVCDLIEGCSVNGNGTYVASGKSKISDQQALLQLIYHLT